MSTLCPPQPRCARGWAGAPGGLQELGGAAELQEPTGTWGAAGNAELQEPGGCLPHTPVPAWHYPGTEWVGEGKDGCGWAQLPHNAVSSE